MSEQRGVFSIAKPSAEYGVIGIIIYPFGIDKRAGSLDEAAGWYVTHLPCGLTFPCRAFRSQKAARAFIRRMQPKNPIWSDKAAWTHEEIAKRGAAWQEARRLYEAAIAESKEGA